MTMFVFICMYMCIRYVYKLQVHVPSTNACIILRILPRPLLFELTGESFSLCFQKTEQQGCQVVPMFSSILKVLVVVGTTLIVLVWRAVGHATASRADAGPCIFN